MLIPDFTGLIQKSDHASLMLCQAPGFVHSCRPAKQPEGCGQDGGGNTGEEPYTVSSLAGNTGEEP